MIAKLFDLLFGCSHPQCSWPLTVRLARPRAKARTYVVCLSCGREFTYDWSRMERLDRQECEPHTGEVGSASCRVEG
jgi:hypothetical protein